MYDKLDKEILNLEKQRDDLEHRINSLVGLKKDIEQSEYSLKYVERILGCQNINVIKSGNEKVMFGNVDSNLLKQSIVEGNKKKLYDSLQRLKEYGLED